MKFTLAWLKEHLDTQAPLADILYALTDLGRSVLEPTRAMGEWALANREAVEAARRAYDARPKDAA